jgi:hypothetical protein
MGAVLTVLFSLISTADTQFELPPEVSGVSELPF